MAIYRASTQHISRGKNHNVVAAAAYRSGEELTDTNIHNPNAKTYDYNRKQGVLAKGIILPKSLSEQGFAIDRQTLWSNVEQHETTTRSVKSSPDAKGSRLKQSARLAREWLLSLPHELSDTENEQLTAAFTQRLADDLGVIGDYCIHKPTVANYKLKADYIESYDFETNTVERTYVDKIEASEPDKRNIHAHIMFTTRKAEIGAAGELKLGDKADSERSELWRQQQKMVNGGDYIKQIRLLWADMVNERLAQHEIAPVSALSYKDQGLDIQPQYKQGKNASTLALYGFKPPIIGLNNDIERDNRAAIEQAADQRIADNRYSTKENDRRLANAIEFITKAGAYLSRSSDQLGQAAPSPFDRKQRSEDFNRQSSDFDKLSERADQRIAKRRLALEQQAIDKYREINSYHPYLSRSDWSNPNNGTRAAPIPNPEPDPKLDFDQRQLDMIENIESERVLRDSLSGKDNSLLMLLTDPYKEREQYASAAIQATQEQAQPKHDAIINSFNESTERELKPDYKPSNTITNTPSPF